MNKSATQFSVVSGLINFLHASGYMNDDTPNKKCYANINMNLNCLQWHLWFGMKMKSEQVHNSQCQNMLSDATIIHIPCQELCTGLHGMPTLDGWCSPYPPWQRRDPEDAKHNRWHIKEVPHQTRKRKEPDPRNRKRRTNTKPDARGH